MQELYNQIKHYNFEDALGLEESDRQFIALQKLYDCEGSKCMIKYLVIIILNSIICYQLSGKGEDYWEEFAEYFCSDKIKSSDLIKEISEFIKWSKNNKRFVDTKIKRLKKLKKFVEEFSWKEEYYYKNMVELRDDLAKSLNQKVDSKTIVFAVKMFGYWARNHFVFEKYPHEIWAPIDSRLTNLFEKYKWEYSDINKFYNDLSSKIKIPPLHLDGVVWTLYDKLMSENV